MLPADISGSSGGLHRSSITSECVHDINSVSDLETAVASASHLLIHLFAGIDGASEAMHQLCPSLNDYKVLHLWFETDQFCQTSLRAHSDQWHRLVLISDEQGISSSVFSWSSSNWALCKSLSICGSHLLSITVIAGSPCVGFSRAKRHGKGIDDPESEKMWIVPSLHTHLQQLFPNLSVGFILENVVMKEQASKDSVSSALKTDPILTKAEDFCPCARSRLIWTNSSTDFSSITKVQLADVIKDEWFPAFELSKFHQRFGTFLRPFGPGMPSEYPASFPRLPLSAYDHQGLLVSRSLSQEAASDIQDRLLAISKASGDSRDSSSEAFRLRRDLCEWIHTSGGSSSLRPLSAAERLRCLGFRSLSAPESSSSFEEQVPHLRASGNTFAVPVFMGLLRPLVNFITGQSELPYRRVDLNLPDKPSALRALGSSKACR